MKQNIRTAAYVVEMLIGVALVIGNMVGAVDTYWSGAGAALIAVSAVFLFRQVKYRKNETYREAVDVEVNDERNRYLGMKAWALAGYLYVITAGIASFVLKMVGEETLSVAAGLSVAFVALFYWISYLYLRKKY